MQMGETLILIMWVALIMGSIYGLFLCREKLMKDRGE